MADMNNTLDLNVANLREIATDFGVTSDGAKAIASEKPCSQTQLVNNGGFSSTFFESTYACSHFHWRDKLSVDVQIRTVR